jgi:hypothetical protein
MVRFDLRPASRILGLAVAAGVGGEFSMSFVFGLLLMCAICATIGIFRGLINRREERKRAEKTGVPGDTVRQHVPSRAVWVNTTEFSKLINSESDTVVFQLIDGTGTSTYFKLVRGELAVTLQEFKDTLPSIPQRNRIALYRPGGIDAAIARQICAVANGREVLLLSGNLLGQSEDPVAAGGQLWN